MSTEKKPYQRGGKLSGVFSIDFEQAFWSQTYSVSYNKVKATHEPNKN